MAMVVRCKDFTMALDTLYFLGGFSLCLQAFGGWESNHIFMSHGHINWQFCHAHTIASP